TDVEIELPKKSEKLVQTKLSEKQRVYYAAILEKRMPEVLSPTAWQQMKNKGSSIQNLSMQLRKCCNHPFLFEWPTNGKNEEIVDESIIQSSGKIQMLEKLLPRMKKEGNKVLIFSQMTRMLDILEDYLR